MKLTEIEMLIRVIGGLVVAVIVLRGLCALIGTDVKTSPIDPAETKELP